MDRSAKNLEIARLLTDDDDTTAIRNTAEKIGLIEWTEDEYELLRIQVNRSPYLDKLITAAIWSWDRIKLNVMIKSFDYCEVLGRSSYNKDSNWISTLIRTFDQMVSESWRATFRSVPPKIEDIARISAQLNATYLMKTLQLYRDDRFATDLDRSDNILVPLIDNNDAINDALPTILNVWASASMRWQHRPRIEELLDIASLISEYPNAGEFISRYAKERLSYDGGIIREQLGTGAVSLGSGTL